MTETADKAVTFDKDTLQKVKTQVEFYFSDENLPRDKFMLNEIKTNEGGWIDISVFTRFKKLAEITTDIPTIAAALADSKLVEVSDCKTKLRRNGDIPDIAEIDARTIYCKNLPKDQDRDQLAAELGKHGEIGAIRMKKDPNSQEFTGCAFVVFKKKDDSDKLLEQKTIEYAGQTVELMNMETYNTTESPASKKHNKHLEEEERKKAEIERRKAEIENERVNFPPKCLLHFSGLKDTQALTYAALKEYFGQFGEVSHIKYENAETEGVCRFKSATSCERALSEITAAQSAGAESKPSFVVGGVIPTVELVTGEEEKKHWDELANHRLQDLLEGGNGRRRGGRGGRGRGRCGRGGRGGRGRGGRGGRRDSLNDGGDDAVDEKVKIDTVEADD